MFQQRPAHATVVAYLALFAALATGGAYAADKITSGDIKKNAVKSKHIGPKQVKAGDIKPGAAKPRAIALIDHDGANPSFNSAIPRRGFAQVVGGDIDGSYCIAPSPSSGLDPAKDVPFITFDDRSSNDENTTAVWVNPSTRDCQAGEYDIRTLHGSDSLLTNDAGFVIAVP